MSLHSIEVPLHFDRNRVKLDDHRELPIVIASDLASLIGSICKTLGFQHHVQVQYRLPTKQSEILSAGLDYNN